MKLEITLWVLMSTTEEEKYTVTHKAIICTSGYCRMRRCVVCVTGTQGTRLFAMNIVAIQSSNSHIPKDHLHSRRRSSEKMKPNNGITRHHIRRKPQSCLGVFRELQNNKPHSMTIHTRRYSATLSGHSALYGDECDVMSEMPNEEQCSAVLPQK